MNKRAWIAAACAIVLGSCATHGERSMRAAPDAVVSVENGRIVVRPDPIVVERQKRNYFIVWEISADSAAWSFGHQNTARPGIVIQRPDGEFERCHQRANGRRFACFNKHERSGRYKYDINLTGPSALSLDPVIIND